MEKRGRIEGYKLNIKQLIKWHFKHFKHYIYTSAIGAVLMFSLLFIFVSVFKIHYLFSFTIVYVIVTTNAFLLNKLFVFKFFNPKRIHRQYYEFFLFGIIVYIANLTAIYIFVQFIGIWYLLSQAIISLIGMPLLYLAHRHLVFSHV